MSKKSAKRKVQKGGGVAVAARPAAPATPTKTTISASPVRAVEFNPDYTHVIKDLRRIGLLAGSFFVILIALSFILPLILHM